MESSAEQDKVCPYHGVTCTIPYGTCHCGCGQTTGIAPRNYLRGGPNGVYDRQPVYRGWPRATKRGHAKRLEGRATPVMLAACPYHSDGSVCTVGYSKCHCGCGETTNWAGGVKRTGHHGVQVQKGWYFKYRRGHNVYDRDGSRRPSDDQVRQIRERYLAGGISQRELAAEFALSRNQVQKILMVGSYREA